jgi:hypothetical protein
VKSYVLLLALVLPLSAQTSPQTPGSVAVDASIKDSLIKHWKTSGEFTIAVADAMPAENYGFRPNPEEMSFGELITHIGAFVFLGCQSASGISVPEFPAKINEWARAQTKVEIDKTTALPFLRDAFAFCDKAIESMTPESLAKRAANQSAFEWLWQYFTHTAHHRGQAEVYLRLKGIKPPDYVF